MPSAIPRRPESGERRGEVDRSGAWLVPPRRIGKLDMRRDMAVRRPCASDVVAIHRDMIEVEKQSEPSRTDQANHIGRFVDGRSEEHTSELQSLMRISYAVFCLKKTQPLHTNNTKQTTYIKI